jgi:hypothetical protein
MLSTMSIQVIVVDAIALLHLAARFALPSIRLRV